MIAVSSATTLRKREHIEHASLGRILLQLLRGIGKAECSGRVARIQPARDYCPGPSPDSRKHGDVLLSVWALVGDWLADDPGTGLKFPKLISGNCVYSLEPAIHRAEEDHVPRGHDRTTPDRKLVLDHPDRSLVENVPRRELAHV